MDKLRITGIQASGVIGIRPWERLIRQPLRVDLEFNVDARITAAADEITKALDYGVVARRVVDVVARSEFRLIETLAEHIAARLIDEFSVDNVKVIVHKPGAVPFANDTSIEIERSRA